MKTWPASAGAAKPAVAPSGQLPLAHLGLSAIQLLVGDVDAARERIVKNGGSIHSEPFALGGIAKIMIVEGPDGVMFEIAGPLKN